ncbi:cytochrome b [Aliikangiella sp. G2MR2-5]|uniref:cytochrome b n=1 Tax=Aliikangiella sp. G2MR2-5 TaxID=2788943 RepID=UPI0018A8CC60|nr:cytochrome b [Aliikangiella sp. G2MR2-5]
MGMRNTKTHYGKLSIALHWIMALLIIGIIAVGFYMGTMEDGDPKWQLYGYHKATGVIILVLALFRWYWVLSNEKLSAPEGFTKKDIGLAHASKWSLMLMMLVMPVSGMVMSIAAGRAINVFGLFKVPALAEANRPIAGFFHDVHEISAWIIAILVGLHILFALKHHLLNKDETLLRILGRN